MSSLLPRPAGVHSSYVVPAFAQQRRRHAAGSQEDFKERVRHFYRFWFFAAGTAVDGHALAPEDIDIEMETISQHERQFYGVSAVYNVSGIAKLGFYPDTGGPESAALGYLVDGFPHSCRIFAQCPPLSRRTQAAEARCDQLWTEADDKQAQPFHFDENGTRQPLARRFCFPRCMTLRPAYKSNAHQSLDMERWLQHCSTPYNPHSNPAALGEDELWMQLRAQPNGLDETRLGSPSNPLITILRLSVLLADNTRRSVLVVFRIVKNMDGTFRPWRRNDPLIPRLWVPPLPPIQILPQPHLARPRSPPYIGVPADLSRYQDPFSNPLPVPHLNPQGEMPVDRPHSLSHRQRKIYGQESANGTLESRFATL